VFDGELLVRREGGGGAVQRPAAAAEPQDRVAKMLAASPAFVRLYDVLWLDGEDLRSLPWTSAARGWKRWIAPQEPTRFDLSPLVTFADWASCRQSARGADGIEGVMLKRATALCGRPAQGLWFKWKRDPHAGRRVLMYAQRGHGKRSSFYSDFTFGCWRTRARSGRELPGRQGLFRLHRRGAEMARQVTCATTPSNRFGPVREVEQKLVLESGLRFRIARKRPATNRAWPCAFRASTASVIDPFGRAISYLRVSVTDRCDFRCTYCMAEDMTFLPKAETC
jgi:DNA ligase-1